ncbi:MAG: hypothetical protein A2096_10355 [Spirochaetes bacterium GWF1_41_5]|nr:MAG: hypothetical protein A2096_10355 [Spirochaetes bacterium GWF1_41_5]HBE04534.1 FmdB family transcriptional regulator [Spirochaetia bacterium]
MPTYEYRCESCSNEFEVFQSINSAPEIECPSCKTIARRKISLGAGIIFRGSGFHNTDYKNSKNEKKEKKENSAKEACSGCKAKSECPAAAAAAK